MPISLKDLISKTRRIPVKIDDETALEVVYRVNYWTPAVSQEFRDDNSLTGQAEVLAKAMASWDVTGEDGKAFVPPKGLTRDEEVAWWKDVLFGVGMPVINAIANAVIKDQLPNDESGETSDDT